MENYYKLDSKGIPTPAKDIRDFSKWANKHHRTKITQHFDKDGMPVEIMTCFNYSEGYFQTFQLEGTSVTKLEKSKTKEQAESVHSRHVDNLTTRDIKE